MSLFQITKSISGLIQFVSPIDHRRYFSGLHEIGEECHVLFIELRNVGDELLADEPRPHIRVQLAGQTHRDTVMPPCSSNSRHDADSVWIQNATSLGE